jgi:hypothetical protein
LALSLADKQQQLHHSVAVPLQAANQFYQPLFSNFPSAVLSPSEILSSAILFPAISLQPTTPHPKASHPPSPSLLYSVVDKEVEQQLSGRGMTL